MTPQEKGRVVNLATDVIHLADRFDTFRSEPDVPTFMGLVRDLTGEVMNLDGDEPALNCPSHALEMALTGYIVNGTVPDFNWFAPAARGYAVKLRDEALAALEPLVEIDDDDEDSN